MPTINSKTLQDVDFNMSFEYTEQYKIQNWYTFKEKLEGVVRK